MSKRNRGPRWSSPKQSDRTRPGKMVYLSKALHAKLKILKKRGENISAIAEEALRAHPKVALPPENPHDAVDDDSGSRR